MRRISKTQYLTCFLAVVSALVVISPAAYGDFRVRGELDVLATGAEAYHENYNIQYQAALSGSASVTGTAGNWADGAYYTNLATGSLGTRAHAYGDGDGDGAASSTAFTYFCDTLTFSIPTGTTEDLYVTLNGHLDGTIGTSENGLATATQEWYFRFAGGLGGEQFDSGLTTALCTDPITNTDFSLTAPIFKNTHLVTLTLTAYLKSKASVPSQGSAAWADVDFYSTGRFLSLDTPDGVTWTSESGVFLSEASPVTPVPEPTSMILVGLGLMTSLVKLRRSQNGGPGGRSE